MITVLHLITGLKRGGAESTLARLTTGTDPTRFRSVIVSMTPPTALWHELAARGMEIYSLNMPQGRPSISGLLKFRRILNDVRPDILQTWLYHADLLGTLAGPRRQKHLVWNIRNSDMRVGGRLAHRLLVKLLASLSRVPSAIITNSLSGRVAHEQAGYSPRRWVFLPNGYDTKKFAPNPNARRELRTLLGLRDDSLLIGMIARFDPMKDHETFFAAAADVMKSLGRANFLLAGAEVTNGNERLAAIIVRHGLQGRVHLLGERPDVAEILQGLDVLALSSAYGEGLPNVVAEAMACAVPVVATDVGDTRLILQQGGTLIPPRDPQILATALIDIARRTASERERMGEQGRAFILRHFSIDAMIHAYEELYQSLVQGSSVGPRDLPPRVG